MEQPELLDQMVFQVPLDFQAGEAFQDLRGVRESGAVKVLLDFWVFLEYEVHQVQRVKMVHRVKMDFQEFKVLMADLAYEERMDRKVYVDCKVEKAVWVLLVFPEDQGHLDRREARVGLELQVPLVKMVPRDKKDLEERRVLMVRMAPQGPMKLKN